MKVNANVLLRNPQTGAVTVINAGEEVPSWAKSMVGDHLTAEETKPEPKSATPARKSRAKSARGEAQDSDDN